MTRPDDGWSSAWTYTLAALLLGGAIQLNLGMLSTGAILLVTLALALCVLGIARPRWLALRERNVLFAIQLALVIQVGLLLIWPPGTANALQDSGTLLPFRLAILVAGAIGLSTLVFATGTRWRIGAVVAVYLLAGMWVIAQSPNPPNDVWYFQQTAGHALLAGQDPYSIEMPNIYPTGSGLYAASIEHGATLGVGFPYPPLSLLLVLPGFLLGDVRYALLVASALAAVLVMRSRPGPVATGAGLLLLFTPRTFFIVEQAWTEPLVLMLLALVVFLACRESRFTPAGVGLLAAVKQHMLLTLPLAILMLPRPIDWRALLRAGGVAVTVTLVLTVPFAVLNGAAFWHSLVEFQFLQPARPDALAFPAWLAPQLPWVASIAGFIALVPAGALVAWRAARTPAGFAGATALVYLSFFAFSKQAFANYYYFVIGALCIAVAATSIRGERHAMTMSAMANSTVGP